MTTGAEVSADMKLKIDKNGYTTFVLASIPFYMLFSREGTFNIQSILIPIVLLMAGHILFGNGGKKSRDCLMILALYIVSMFIPLMRYILHLIPRNIMSRLKLLWKTEKVFYANLRQF